MIVETQSRSRAGQTLLFLSAVASGGIGGFLGNFLTKALIPDGDTQGAVWPWISGFLFAILGIGVAVYYWTILGYGGFAKGSRQRERYNHLRTSLRTGGNIGRTYERMLRAALNSTDRLIGDAGKIGRSRISRFFGIRESVPLWTARSYDRCLQIAFTYPIAVIVLVWVISGHVGPAEQALSLSSAEAWGRSLVCLGVVLLSVGFVLFLRLQNSALELLFFIIAFIGFVFLNIVLGFVSAIVISSSFFMISILQIPGLFSVFFCGGVVGFSTTSISLAVGASPQLAAMLGGALFVIFTLVFLYRSRIAFEGDQIANLDNWLGRLLLISMPIAFVAAIASPLSTASTPYWAVNGPMLLFYGLLAVVNAPFDWITLGLTRALLRRGLELGGWWPLVFSLIDLLAAAVVVAVLAVVTLWSVQLFGHFTQLGGGELILDAGKVLSGLADEELRTAPEFWWLYVMLFSTLIPSIINVAIGALSLMRGIPGLHNRLSRRMPVGAAVLESERMWIAPILAGQSILAIAAGTVVMLGLIWLILEWGLPMIGLNLVSMLQALAAEDLPGELLRLLGVG